VVLAMAGLDRLGLSAGVARPLDGLLPAPGQAAIALESRAGDRPALEVAALIDDATTHVATDAERLLHQALGGGCRAPVGALATTDGKVVKLEACVAALDGTKVVRAKGQGTSAKEIAEKLAKELLAQGAEKILEAARAALAVDAGEGA
jgi:hydroxymethylbilane synthase